MWLENKKILEELNKTFNKIILFSTFFGFTPLYMSQAEGEAAAEKPVCT